MRSKKTLWNGLLLIIMVFLIATVIADAEETTTINYAFWGNPAAIGVEKDIIEEFEKKERAGKSKFESADDLIRAIGQKKKTKK